MSIFRYLSGHGNNYGGYGGHGHYGSGRGHGGHGGHGYNRREGMATPQSGNALCPHCQRANDGDARFCASCGGALIAQCPHCQQMLPPMAAFCSKCGKEVNAVQGSKLVK